MKIFQKAGKLTIEGEANGAAKADKLYDVKQLVDDLVLKTKSGEIEWVDGYDYQYHATVGDTVVAFVSRFPLSFWVLLNLINAGYSKLNAENYKYHLKIGFVGWRLLDAILKQRKIRREKILQQEVARAKKEIWREMENLRSKLR